MADAINNQFLSVAGDIPQLNTVALPAYLPSNSPCPEIFPWQVYAELRKVNIRKAVGPDGIPLRLIHEFAYELSTPVTDILNLSFATGKLPSQWKKAVVIPVPKTNPPTIQKLRPISLTDYFAKVAEKFAVRWILQDIQTNLDPQQFGNRRGVSTTHYLANVVDTLAQTADKPNTMSTLVATDYSKAFDRVNHTLLITKLLDLGTRPSVIPWICDFLCERQQSVRYNSVLSDWCTTTAGVPQGTRLGPVAFLAIINDAAWNTSSKRWKYVDDMTLVESSKISTPSHIQEDLNRIEDWSVSNHLKLNPDKCAVMRVCFKRCAPATDQLRLCDQPLQECHSLRILGLVIQSDLRWDQWICEITCKASRRLYMLKLLKHFALPAKDLVTIYKGYVRPILEYAVPVWSSGLTQQQNDALEQLQKRACKIIMGTTFQNYKQSLNELELSTLASRRVDICYKFAHGLLKNDKFNSWLPELRSQSHNYQLRDNKQLSVPFCRTARYKNSPIPYLTRLWNTINK